MVNVNIPNKMFSNVLKIGILVVVVVMIGSFLKPTITGSFIEDINALNKTATSCKDKLIVANANFININDTANKLAEDFTKLGIDYDECKADSVIINNEFIKLKEEYNKTSSDYNVMKVTYEQMKDDLNESYSAYDDLESDFDKLANSSANRICCIKRIDNPDINYYSVKSNKITCLEEGDYELACP